MGTHVLQSAKHAIVLDGMMRRSHNAIAVATAIADKLHIEVVQTYVVTDLLEGPPIHEGCDAVCPALFTDARRALGYADHVLFGDAGVNEPFTHGALQRLKGHEAEVPCEEHKALLCTEHDQRRAEGVSHPLGVAPP